MMMGHENLEDYEHTIDAIRDLADEVDDSECAKMLQDLAAKFRKVFRHLLLQ